MVDRQLFMEALDRGLAALQLSGSEQQKEMMWRHFELLRAANAEVNLTTVTAPGDAAVRHFADSLAAAAWLADRDGDPLHLLDVGTGGGFPALPLAVLRPAWRITAIDGTGRKTECVQRFIEELGLTNCSAQQARAEHWDGPADFDVVLFRAVAPLGECLHKARRVTRPGTVIVCYKGDPLEEGEAQGAGLSSLRRRYQHIEDRRYELSCGDEVLRRQLCIFRRI